MERAPGYKSVAPGSNLNPAPLPRPCWEELICPDAGVLYPPQEEYVHPAGEDLHEDEYCKYNSAHTVL